MNSKIQRAGMSLRRCELDDEPKAQHLVPLKDNRGLPTSTTFPQSICQLDDTKFETSNKVQIFILF
jgi:hypothetical protein